MALSHNIGLLLIDIQEKLFAKIVDSQKLLVRLQILSQACTILQLPIIQTEQYPAGLGKTIEPLRTNLASINCIPFEKTSFSCLLDERIKDAIISSKCTTWIVAGIESHICVMQTVRSLIQNNITPIVVQDAIGSRTLLDHQSALQEMQNMGARITTTETILFELLEDAKHPLFKEIAKLLK